MNPASASRMEVDDRSGGIDPLAVDERVNNESSRKWLKCMMGCDIDEKRSITRLDCMHFICSDQCIAKLKKETKSGLKPKCKQCSRVLDSNQLSVKIIPKDVFVKKKDTADVTLVCDHCVWNRPAVAYCPECPSCLCTPCKELHPQARATVKHKVTNNLAEYKAKQLAKLKEDESKCKTHSKPCTSYCKSCSARICEICLSSHEGHVTFHIETVKKKLKSQIDLARKLKDKYGSAALEIERKRKEIFDNEWENVMRLISDQFSVMLTILRERENTLKHEARTRFIKQIAALNMRMKCAKLSKASGERFIEVGEDIFNNGDFVAWHNFLEEYKNYEKWQGDMDTQMTNHFDRYVDKNWHFTLDTSAIAEAQKYLSEYGQVEYKLKPDSEILANASASCSRTIPANSSSVSKAGSGAASGKLSNTEVKKPISRRIAVKSTGAPQVTARNLTKVSPIEENIDNSKLSRASGRIKKKAVDPEDVATESDDDEYFPSRVTRSKLEKMQQIGETPNADAMEEGQQSNNESELVEVVSNCDAQTEIVESSFSDDAASSSSKVNKTTGSTQLTSKKLENEKENINGNNAKEIVVSRSAEVPMDAVVPKVDTRNASALDKSNTSPTKAKPDGASPDSSVSESSERGLGKRERKKKEFPEFVDTDKSIKMLRKQTAETIASTTRVRRKSGKPRSSGVLSHDQVVMKAEGIANENSARLMEDAELNVNSEVENGHDYESGDDGLETATRRHSLRRRAAPTPDTPESSNKRPRRSSLVDDHSFPQAPLSSFEGTPDLNDYPIQGQGRMKISNVDENDDYCCVCLDGGEEVIVCCDFCPKVFHLNCHIPVITVIPEGEAKWRCNYETTKETVDALIADNPDVAGSEQASLDESNPRHFILACKFLMEIYKIPESPTMRYLYPEGYLAKFGKVPFNLRYIRERLCLGIPSRFVGVREMMLAFQQMFIQASMYYKKVARKSRIKEAALHCFQRFLNLVEEYYPEYRNLYMEIEY